MFCPALYSARSGDGTDFLCTVSAFNMIVLYANGLMELFGLFGLDVVYCKHSMCRKCGNVSLCMTMGWTYSSNSRSVVCLLGRFDDGMKI